MMLNRFLWWEHNIRRQKNVNSSQYRCQNGRTLTMCDGRWERETLEVWLRSKERLLLTDLKLPRGEKTKKPRKRVEVAEAEAGVDLKEVGQHNYDLLVRKLSANLARKL